MKRIVPVSAVAVSLLVCSLAWAGENWPQWRGPNFDGSSKATGLPDKIGPDQNLIWKAVLPGPSNGTPIIWDDAVFVSSLESASKKLLALRIDRKTGREIWRKEVGLGFKTKGANNMASPSPITDGKHVWFHYASGDLVCFTMAGEQVWTRNIINDHGSLNYMWIYGSSPLLYKGKLYVQVLHNVKPYGEGKPGESYLLAIEPATGKDLWKVVRPTEAVNESQESYGTPIPFLSSERQEVVLVGGDAVTGHDSETGKELWRATGWNPGKEQFWRLIPSACTGGNMVFACAPKRGPVMAINGGGSGTVPFAWSTKEFTSDVCVPLFYNDKLYILDGDNQKMLSCIDPKTGKVLWQGKLGGKPVFRASPTGADGKIYCMNEAGQVWVLSTEKFEILSQADLGGPSECRGTIAAVDGQVFVRTGDALYCFGKK